MIDNRPSIAELQAIYREDSRDCLAIIEAVPVLLEIAAAALVVEASEYGTAQWTEARDRYQAALWKVQS